MNNKKIGSDFEQRVCDKLASLGYWTHFITPDRTGSQPFDIIAVKDGIALAIDCKTCVSNTFNISRLEDNQIMAFDLWIERGNSMPLIFVEHKEKVIIIRYDDLKRNRSIKLNVFQSEQLH